jgi:hypothetical protein
MNDVAPDKNGLLRKRAHLRRLESGLAGVFRIGNPMTPQDRLAACKDLIEAARQFVNGLENFDRLALRREIEDVERAIEEVEERRDVFRARLR